MNQTDYGRLVFRSPPLAEEGELERERARLVGRYVQHSRLPVASVDIQDGTCWAHFLGTASDGRVLSCRWVARNCVLVASRGT